MIATHRLRSMLLCLALPACMPVAFGLQITPPPPLPPEPPVPDRFEGRAPPVLELTRTPGLSAAPTLDPTLCYYSPIERWYRFAFQRWYEAFAWNGNWFPLEETPGFLENFVIPDDPPHASAESDQQIP